MKYQTLREKYLKKHQPNKNYKNSLKLSGFFWLLVILLNIVVEFCLNSAVIFRGFFVYCIVEYLAFENTFVLYYAIPVYIITPIGFLFRIGCSTDNALRQKTNMY